MTLHVDTAFLDALHPVTDVFDHLMSLDGAVLRQMDNRRTLRCTVAGQPYIAKIYTRVRWVAILCDFMRFKRTVWGARPEWEAITRLRGCGIPVPELVAYGERGWIPGRRLSFLVMKELQNVRTLEEVCAGWKGCAPRHSEKRRILLACARIVRTLHELGINHRDLYICHFFLSREGGEPGTIHLYDLHRAQIRHRVPRRWLVKDLAALYYSVRNVGLSRHDLFRFLTLYYQDGLRRVMDRHASLLRSVVRKAESLGRKGTKG